ncbi:MAG: hypothetical protein GY862_26025, partial [Gammaproteobacteria bacterium]|nr:hypothetical protein [Gammaproteobacteria bacterium]
KLGIDGIVRINAPDEDAGEGLIAPAAPFLDASALLEERCIARVDEESSRLVRTGRDNMPGDELDDMTATGAYLDIAAPIRP